MKILTFFFAALLLISCKSKPEAEPPSLTSDEVTPAPESGSAVIIETSLGTIKVSLHEDTAPNTVKNFLSYVDEGFYNDTIFHRVIANFMIQGGGFEIPQSTAKQKKPGEPILNESENTRKNTRGTLAMARTPDPHSATAQFFINVVDNASLDYPNNGGGYAVFGEVTEGMEVVDQIRDVKTQNAPLLNLIGTKYGVQTAPDVPIHPVYIKSIQRAAAVVAP